MPDQDPRTGARPPAEPRDGVTSSPARDRVALAATLAAAALVAVFSVSVLTRALVVAVPYVVVPSALGVPFGLPALRLVPLGDLTWATTLVDTAAAGLLLLAVHGRVRRTRRRRPAAGAGRVFLSGWGALVVASALAGLLRGGYIGGVTPTGPVAALGYAAAGLLAGVLCGLLLGWAVGLAAVTGRWLSRPARGWGAYQPVGGASARSRVRRAGVFAALACGAWLLGAATSGPLGVRGDHADAVLTPISVPVGTPARAWLAGVNSSGTAKSAPDGQSWVVPADIAREHDMLGSTAVRYLVFWSHLEPEPGQYDEDYLDAVAERVRWYREARMQVVLDMHQDVWGPSIGFDGAPDWATRTDGLPSTLQEQWELTYLQPGVIRAFDHFWGTTGDLSLQQRYVAALAHLAARFADEPGVLGIDVMNEPYGGTLQGPLFEQGPLSAFYQRAIDAVRPVAPGLWVFVEPQAFGVNQGLPSGLVPLHDPRAGAPRVAFAPHLYPLPLDLGGAYADQSQRIDDAIEDWRGHTRATALRMGTPAWLGEFGLDGTRAGAPDYVTRVLRTIRAAGFSGYAYWDNSPGSWSPWDADDPTQLSPIGEALATGNRASG